MLSIEKLNEELERLETFYADSLANEASCRELNKIWKEIKEVREQLKLVLLFNPQAPIPVQMLGC